MVPGVYHTNYDLSGLLDEDEQATVTTGKPFEAKAGFSCSNE